VALFVFKRGEVCLISRLAFSVFGKGVGVSYRSLISKPRGEVNLLHPSRGRAKERYSFAKLVDVLDLPNLIEIQRSSYQWFWSGTKRDV